jgi:molecular chaperone GrpE (heat shock protein)
MSYLSNLIAALGGRTPAPHGAPLSESDARHRVARLEQEVRDRDERIAAMQAEYAALREEKASAAAGAGEVQMEKLFKKLCAPLATLSTLAHAVRKGQAVEARDLADMVESVEKALMGFGLEPIGEPGTEAPFDSAAHQRMSGGSPHSGDQVRVRLPGYRLGKKILQKAMVSGKEEA